MTHWRAIVAFTDTDDVSDDWNWFYGDIRDACAGTDVHVAYAEPGVDEVVVGPARVGIAEFRVHRKGYLFMESGRETVFVPYDQSRITLQRAAEHFGTDLSVKRA